MQVFVLTFMKITLHQEIDGHSHGDIISMATATKIPRLIVDIMTGHVSVCMVAHVCLCLLGVCVAHACLCISTICVYVFVWYTYVFVYVCYYYMNLIFIVNGVRSHYV